jgi:hypothetical protein
MKSANIFLLRYQNYYRSLKSRVADLDPYPDPDWIRILIGSVDRDPDPGGQKCPTKVEIFFKAHVLKCCMAFFEG